MLYFLFRSFCLIFGLYLSISHSNSFLHFQ
nr:MAG TPA: hypothetical protein [Caudoviricetes sp.]